VVSDGQHGADYRFEASVAYSCGESGAVGFDDEEQCPPVAWLGLGWLGDDDERAAGTHQCGRAGQKVSAGHLEHHVAFSSVLERFDIVGRSTGAGEVDVGTPSAVPFGVSVALDA
jgi:hypothetical protein